MARYIQGGNSTAAQVVKARRDWSTIAEDVIAYAGALLVIGAVVAVLFYPHLNR